MIPQIYVSLMIQNEAMTLQDLDILNDIGATSCWMKGQKKPINTYFTNGCKFESKSELSYKAGEVALHFVRELIDTKPELVEIICKYNLSPMLTIAVYFSDIMPGIVIDYAEIQFLAKYNISINFDTYMIEDDSMKQDAQKVN